MKKLLMVLLLVTVSITLTGCGKKAVKYDGIGTDVVGQIDILMWGGSGTYLEDIGHSNLAEDEIFSRNDAAAIYTAREFNKIYPNVTINVQALIGGPEQGGRIWSQELENYKAEHGVHPSVWASRNLTEDLQKGLVADLSRFQDDPLYKSMNPSVLKMMNFHGFQAGLPQYILPWGIFVNKELAEDQNLDVPDPDWTIDEYTDFVQNSEKDVYYGSNGSPMRLIFTGVNTMGKQLFEYDGTGDFLDINSDEVRSLIPYLDEWNEHSVNGSDASAEFRAEYWNWGYKYFAESKLLTYEYDPWMMGDCANPDEDYGNRCKSSDWDIYPRPSTEFVDNTVGIVLDPMAVYNYCLDDGDLACSEEEELKIQIAYTFASFWVADTRAWQARADGLWTNETDGTTSSSLTASLPITTGDVFETQMGIWYSAPDHERFSDAALMPGFHEVLRIYSDGQFWVISDKSYPLSVSVEGTMIYNLNEWNQYWNSSMNGGVSLGDANFTDTILGDLATWNELSNARFAESFADLEYGLKTYYGYTDEDLNK
ncbi:MAG: extracellular solute-binding protein [Candidatus Izimaplasma sp.]|nr:extracellular solute-binding protein [Candidatus Izimaplasma bacterium]